MKCKHCAKEVVYLYAEEPVRNAYTDKCIFQCPGCYTVYRRVKGEDFERWFILGISIPMSVITKRIEREIG